MTRRLVAWLGPHEIQPWALGAIMAMFFLVYSLGVFNDGYMTNYAFTAYGVAPSVIAGVIIALIGLVFRAWQRRHGVRWSNYLLALLVLAAVAPSLRATFEFLPQLPSGPLAYPVNITRSFINLWVISAILSGVSSRLSKQVDETEQALELARRQQVQIITADEEARRQVSILLHDRVQAGLITNCMELRSISGELDESTRKRLDPLIGRLEDLRSLDVRGAARVLSPNLEEIDLQTALEELALQYEAVLVIDVDVDEAVDVDRSLLGSGLPLATYRIVEQALLNAVVHARATHVVITVTRTADGCRAAIADDGVGVDPAAVSGMGTTLVNTWTRAMHGDWHWEAGIGGRGTSLVADLRAVELTA